MTPLMEFLSDSRDPNNHKHMINSIHSAPRSYVNSEITGC